MKRLLIVDDDNMNCVMAEYALSKDYEVFAVNSGSAALYFLENEPVDLILMDIEMPEMSGKEVASKIKENPKWSKIPIIFLTADSDPKTEAECLSWGADDFITKPFVPVEVLARVRSQLRRYATLGSCPEPSSGNITIGGVTLDDRTKSVTVEGEAVSLTPTEYAILHLLMANPGKVFSTKVLYESVWQEAALGSEGAVAVHIRHLREKIEINPSEPRYLKVVWGQGYKMEGDNK